MAHTIHPLAGENDEETVSNIDHPVHYGGDTVYEAIKVIEAWNLGFCLGNCVKYICRAGRKGPLTHVEDLQLEDLKKAQWYLQHEIEEKEKVLAQRRAQSQDPRSNVVRATRTGDPKGLQCNCDLCVKTRTLVQEQSSVNGCDNPSCKHHKSDRPCPVHPRGPYVPRTPRIESDAS